MSDPVFNHVGLCVSDLERSRRFYEEALGFSYWWEFEAPDEQTGPVLRLEAPVGLTALYLVHGSVVLELLHYAGAGAHPAPQPRTMNELGLTHLSLSVGDIPAAVEKVTRLGGEVLADTGNGAVVFVRDPDGQLLELSSMDWRAMLPPLPGAAGTSETAAERS